MFVDLCGVFQYILSGSDDFNLYMWKIPEEPTESELLLDSPIHYSLLPAVSF